MDQSNSTSLSDDGYFEGHHFEGTLSKWTNYISGWQDRWVILNGPVLAYYRSEADVCYGCRGSLNLKECRIVTFDDELRFDIEIQDSVYYLRAETEDLQKLWLQHIRAAKAIVSEPSSDNLNVFSGGLVGHRRTSSLSSCNGLSSSEGNIFQGMNQGCGMSRNASSKMVSFREKHQELETYRDILVRQTFQLQNYFEEAAEGTKSSPERKSGVQSVRLSEIREGCLTFKATTQSMLENLDFCIEHFQKYDEENLKRLETQVAKYKSLEIAFQALRNRAHSVSKFGDPDMEEGPHSKLNEGEFFDAVEYALDENDKIQEQELKNEQEPHIIPLALSTTRHRFSDQID
eukprot:Sdes_comp21742_c0_seq1m20312